MGTLQVSADSMPKVSRCWRGPERTCDPDQAGFSASLINAVSGPSRFYWSRSCVPLTMDPTGDPVWVLTGVRRLRGQGTLVLEWAGRAPIPLHILSLSEKS